MIPLFLSLQTLELTLLDITPMMESLKGVVMELQDCALNLLKSNCHLWVWLVNFLLTGIIMKNLFLILCTQNGNSCKMKKY